MLNTAQQYQRAGLSVLPAMLQEKRPAVSSWKPYQDRLPTEVEIKRWFAANPDAICIITGSVSGNLEIIDFDHTTDLFDAWRLKIPASLYERLVIESSPSGGRHVIYRCESSICGNVKLVQRQYNDNLVTMIETRGNGGLFLCAPTPGYRCIQGELISLPVLTATDRDVLLSAAYELGDRIAESIPIVSSNSSRPGDEYNERGDISQILMQCGWKRTEAATDGNEHWTRPGKRSGTSATLKDRVFYVFSSNASPFEPNRGYSLFTVYSLLQHQGDYQAASQELLRQGYGANEHEGVDLSEFRPLSTKPDTTPVASIPEELFLQVPGFIRDVMDFTLSAAPYPNVQLAFCGALALQSFLAGRKVCTPGDLRPNLFILALAASGTGKDFPRKVNSRILFEIGMSDCLGDKFASGEGIQDALARTGSMLFQNDEMDGVLRQINSDRENRHESIPNILLTLYTSADDIYPIRVKANQQQTGYINQPHLTLFGTATPKYFYESLSQRMLTNGFFARLSVIDVGKRGEGQVPGTVRNIPLNHRCCQALGNISAWARQSRVI